MSPTHAKAQSGSPSFSGAPAGVPSDVGGPFELVTLVRRATESFAALPLLTYERDGRWVQMHYAELARDEVRLRAAMARLGVGVGDRVAVISKNRPEWVVVLAATHALGAILVPMYEVQHPADWRHILGDAKVKLCFTSTRAIEAKVGAMRPELGELTHVVAFDNHDASDASYAHLLRTASPGDAPFVVPAPADLAAFIYTSGTTGKPKGVKLSHGALGFEIRALRDALSADPSDRTISILPWAHVGGFCELVLDIDIGVCIALVSAVDKLGDTIRETRPTKMTAVPRVWNGLYDVIQKGIATKPPAVRWLFAAGIAAEKKKRAGLRLQKRERAVRRLARRVLFPQILARLGGELRQGFSGAAALSKDVAEFFTCLGIDIYELYGQTETSAVATTNRPGAVKLGTVGKPLAGVRLEIDRTVGDADDGSGEIVIHSPGAMSGYHGLPEETAFVRRADGGVRTGDLGRIDEEGFLLITGRVREVYKLENGKFVTPVPIEESLGLSPYIAQAFVWGLNMPHNVALLVVDAASLQKWCGDNGIGGGMESLVGHARVRELYARELAERGGAFKAYERVRSFALLTEPFTTDNGLLTPTLKVKRTAVVARYRAVIDSLYAPS